MSALHANHPVDAVVFDVGRVLVEWDMRLLFAKLIPEAERLDWFCSTVITEEWHFQHDAGRDLAELVAERKAEFPGNDLLIDAYATRFLETIPGNVPGTHEIVRGLAAGGVPLFAITNFSADFWPPFHESEKAFFSRFRDIVVSGEVKLLKPDPAIYWLALDRFRLRPSDALFVDDREINVDGALAVGMQAHLFTDAAGLRARLVAEGLL
jgi:2-haloacid dehalogenase